MVEFAEGIVVKSDYEGYFIRLSPEREIYISNNEIKRLTMFILR